jgi:hypothetical protein
MTAPPEKKVPEPLAGNEQRTSNTADDEAQDATLAGRLLLLRRILLTAIEIIEDIAFSKKGGNP